MSWEMISCPYCGKGRKITVNGNVSSSTTHMTCSGCHKSYTVSASYGKVKVTKQNMLPKKVEFICSYCGKKEYRKEGMGRPMPGKCQRKNGDKEGVNSFVSMKAESF